MLRFGLAVASLPYATSTTLGRAGTRREFSDATLACIPIR
jgi:hypothetical protein